MSEKMVLTRGGSSSGDGGSDRGGRGGRRGRGKANLQVSYFFSFITLHCSKYLLLFLLLSKRFYRTNIVNKFRN
jgi:hypothetical protein